MAILNKKPGYAVLEVNKLQSRTTGNMVANAPLANDFVCSGKDGATQTYAENGMILFHDPTSAKGNRYGAIVAKAAAGNATSFGLVWATEHMYDIYGNALQNFKIDRPTDPTAEATPYEAVYGQQNHFQFYPRLYMLSSSDTFTTDAIDLGTFTYFKEADVPAGTTATTSNCVEKAVNATNGIVYVDVDAGYSKLTTSKGAYTYGVVEKITTLPDGISPAVKIRVIGNDIKIATAE